MAVTRRRTVAAKPVTRRRDRAADPVEEDEEDDVDATRRPARTKATTRTRTRAADPVDDEDDVDDDEDEDEDPPPRRARRRAAAAEDDEEDDDDEEDPPAPRSRRTATRARRPAPVDDDEDDDADEDDEPAPSRRRAAAAKPGRRRSGRPPVGIGVGMAGADATAAAAGSGGVDRLVLKPEPQLIKVLEKEPFTSFRQHWVQSGSGASRTNRPYTCLTEAGDCPLCAVGDRSGAVIMVNIALFQEGDLPVHKVLQIGIRAWENLKEVAFDKTSQRVALMKNYFTVQRTGKDQSSTTTFHPIKPRDVRDDWEEVTDAFDMADLPQILAELKEENLTYEVVQRSSRSDLAKVAKFLASDDDE